MLLELCCLEGHLLVHTEIILKSFHHIYMQTITGKSINLKNALIVFCGYTNMAEIRLILDWLNKIMRNRQFGKEKQLLSE